MNSIIDNINKTTKSTEITRYLKSKEYINTFNQLVNNLNRLGINYDEFQKLKDYTKDTFPKNNNGDIKKK